MEGESEELLHSVCMHAFTVNDERIWQPDNSNVVLNCVGVPVLVGVQVRGGDDLLGRLRAGPFVGTGCNPGADGIVHAVSGCDHVVFS